MQRPLRFVALSLGICFPIGLAFALSTYATMVAKGDPVPWWVALFWSLTEWGLWGLLCPLVFVLARRYPVAGPAWTRHLPLHLGGFLAAHLAHEAAYAVLEQAAGLDGGHSFRQMLLLYLGKRAAFNALVYGAMVALEHLATLHRRDTERERARLQLETKLARAQLDGLRSQLQPHFLFNTLNTISALLHRDPEAADRVLTRLGDLLRLSLQHSVRQEVVLRQELEFVERYLEIQQIRFQDRLRVRIDAEPEVLDALVPTLVLQPLVENAVRHAIEPRAAEGHLRIAARRDEGRLTLQVADDGPGLVGPGRGSGIGLANTRARLEQLYGAAHRFSLANADEGGLLVTLELPFRVGELPTPAPVLHG
jgi:signal transduction histidine kinase